MVSGTRATNRGYRAAVRRRRGERSRNFRPIAQPGETPLTSQRNRERAARHINTTVAAAFRLVTRVIEPNRKPSHRIRTYETESVTGIQHQIDSWMTQRIIVVKGFNDRSLDAAVLHGVEQINTTRRRIFALLRANKVPPRKALQILNRIGTIVDEAAQEWGNQ